MTQNPYYSVKNFEHFPGYFILQLTVSSTPLAVIEWQLYD